MDLSPFGGIDDVGVAGIGIKPGNVQGNRSGQEFNIRRVPQSAGQPGC